MNQKLSTTSLVLETTPKSSIIPKPNHILTARTDKCIKISKNSIDDLYESAIEQLNNNNKQPKPKINLSKVIERDTAYGKSNQKEILDSINIKKKHLLQDDYFSSTVDKYHLLDMLKLPEYFSITNEELAKQLEEIFKPTTLDTPKFEAIKQKMNEFKIEKTKGPIGSLSSCDSLKILINVNNDNAINQTFNEMKSDIKMFRCIFNDGNSFYRAFIFGLFEHHILYGNIIEIGKLVLGIVTKITSKQLIRYNPIISLHEVTVIFYLIYSEVTQHRTKSGYDLLLKAINSSRSFDYALVKYMRIAIGEYIEANADLIFKNESWEEIEQIAAPAYLLNHAFDYTSYIKDCVLAMHYEADKLVIQISPVVFRINLDLFVIEGTASEIKHLIYLKQNYHYSLNASIDNTISLFYSYSRYHKLYSIDYMKQNNINITYRSLREADAATIINYRFHIVEAHHQCSICQEKTWLISFNHIPNNSFCKNCLIVAIDRIIVRRISHFTDENYNNKEYYFRCVSFSDYFEDKLYEEDFIALFNRNIPQQILYTMERLCYRCFKACDKNYETMPCECKLCHDCIIDNILKATDQKIVLNQYEKRQPLLTKVYCPCENIFNVDKAIELVYSNDKDKIDQLKKEAMVRLHKLVEVICAFCGLYHQKANYSKVISLDTNIVKNDYLEVIRFNIIKDSNPYIANCIHIICKNCIRNLRQEVKNKMQKGEIGDKETTYPLNCKICLCLHKINSKFFKTKNDACCIIH